MTPGAPKKIPLQLLFGSDPRSVAFMLMVLVTMVYLVLRAICVPLIQDEVNSFWWYASTGEFMPLLSHPDAGNHLTSSFTGWIGNGLFGPQPLAIRIGSVLAFPVYAAACWRFSQKVSDGVRWIMLLSLLWCPFLYEYFALFRGYGMAMAFFAWALVHLVGHLSGDGTRALWFSAIFFCLATFSNLSLLPVWAAVAGALPMVDLVRKRRTAALRAFWCALAQLPLLAYAAAFALDLRTADLLYLGSGRPFIHATVGSLAVAVFPDGPDGIKYIVTGLTLLATAATIFLQFQAKKKILPLTVVTSMLWLDISIRFAWLELWKVNYPQDRVALHLVVLFILQVAYVIDGLGVLRSRVKWVVLILVPFPLMGLSGVNLDHAMNNGEPAVPYRFTHFAAERQREIGRPLVVSGWGLMSSWSFGMMREGAFVTDMIEDSFNDPDHDLRVLPSSRLDEARGSYLVIDSAMGPGLYLLQRRPPLDLEVITDTMFDLEECHETFRHLYGPSPNALDGEGLFVRVSGNLTMATRVGELVIAGEVTNGPGASASWRTALSHQRVDWKGEAFDVILRLPRGVQRKAYIWNPGQKRFTISSLRVRVCRRQDL